MVSVSNLFWSNGTMFFDDLVKPLGNLGYVSLLCLWFPGFYSNRLNCNFFLCIYQHWSACRRQYHCTVPLSTYSCNVRLNDEWKSVPRFLKTGLENAPVTLHAVGDVIVYFSLPIKREVGVLSLN